MQFYFITYHLEVYKAKEQNTINSIQEEPRSIVLSNEFLLIFYPEQKQTTAGDYYVLNVVIPLRKLKAIEKRTVQVGIISINWQQGQEVYFIHNQ